MVREVGEAGRDRPRPPRACRADDRHGARRRAFGLALRLPDAAPLVMVELALVQWALKLLGKGFEPVIPPVLVREQALYGTGLPARHRAADLPPGRGRPLPRRARARSRSPRCTPARSSTADAAAALRRLLALLPPRGRRGGQGHARDLPRAPVRQGRDVQLRRARGRPPTSTSGCSRSRRRSSPTLGIPYRVVNIARRRPRRLGGEEVRLRGVAAGPGALPRADLVLEHDRLPGAPPRHPLPPGASGRPAHAPHAERHGGRGRAHDHRAARERPAATTARSSLPEVLVRHGAPAVLPAADPAA